MATDEALRPILHQAVLFAIGSLSAERAMVVYHGRGVLHGINAATIWLAGEISTTLLQSLLEEKEPMVMVDAAEDVRTRDQTSAILSALRSVLFVPLRDPQGKIAGLFYGDHQHRAGAFDFQQLAKATQFVDEVLTPQLAAASGESADAELDWDGLIQTRWL